MAQPLSIYLLTFNCARIPIDLDAFAPHLFQASSPTSPLPDILAISLQEVAPIAYSFLGGCYLTPYFDRVVDTVRLAVESHQIAAEYDEEDALEYVNLVTRNVGMTAIMIFVKRSVADQVRWIQTAGTGVGLWRMGNKGAVGVRVGVETEEESEAELTFVAAHLAPMEWNTDRRNEDYEQIVRNLAFTEDAALESKSKSLDSDEERLVATSRSDLTKPTGVYDTSGYVFVFGDLNYRTSDVSPAPDAYLVYPQPDATPGSQNHISSFLRQDQLNRERSASRTFHGFEEVPITFPPTYKYSEKALLEKSDPPQPPSDSEPECWHWSKHRFPSWCDRILFLPSKDIKTHRYIALPIQPTSDHRPVALSVSIDAKPSNQLYTKPFPLNSDYASLRAAARTKEIAVGLASYMALTTEGNVILVGVLAGVVAGVYLLQSLT